MRIGVVTTLFPSRRDPVSGVYVKEELEYLSRHAEIRLVAPFPNHRWFLERMSGLVETPYPVTAPFAFSFPRWFLQQYYPSSLARTIRRVSKTFLKDCDLVHAHNGFAEGVATVKALARDMPVVVTMHGSDVNRFAMIPKLRPLIVDSLNKAAYIICVGTMLREKLAGFGVHAPMTVIPNGIDAGVLRPGDKAEASERLGLDPGKQRLLFAGNFVPVKGIEYLLMAFPAVRDVFPDCELVLIGADPGKGDRTRYDTVIDSAEIRESVRIVNRLPHDRLPLWMHASDVLVLPSLNEGFGLVAAEALGCGRPVVSTRSGGPEDIVIKGTGKLVEPADAEALSRAIISVLHGEGIENAESLSQYAKSKFSHETVTEKILEVYRQVIGR